MGTEELLPYVALPLCSDNELDVLVVRREDINGISTEVNHEDEVEFYVHWRNDKYEVIVENMNALLALVGWFEIDDHAGRLNNVIQNVT